MRTYEVLFILSPQVPEEEATTLIADFKRIARDGRCNAQSTKKRGVAAGSLTPSRSSTKASTTSSCSRPTSALSELDRRMRNSDRILRHMIVRTDLDHKRADKLAKRNPKKERVRPAPSPPRGYASAAPPSGQLPSSRPLRPKRRRKLRGVHQESQRRTFGAGGKRIRRSRHHGR